MRPNKARFVTACQQILALGAVVAVLAPAANVISLDVVGTRPGTQAQEAPEVAAEAPSTALPGGNAQPARAADEGGAGADEEEAEVETAPVEPVVNEFEMAAATTEPEADQPEAEQPEADQPEADQPEAGAPKTQAPERSVAPRKAATAGPTEILSDIEEVTGYGAVGVTWGNGEQVDEDQIAVSVRTRTDGVWSAWIPIDYHDDHAPEASSPEATKERPGTDAMLVGEVDEVQARAVLADGVSAPADMKLAVIAPGTGTTEVEQPAIDTAKLGQGESEASEPGNGGDGAEFDSSEGKLAMQATTYTRKPKIYSRAQWGANERMRDASSLRYYEVHAGFVHHTVNANNYTREQVPGIIRSIYAYHTQSRGWSDVGYNFLVDKFGRIWEGRYGGVDRPVVGAHTLGYNDYSFAMSAIGNFDIARPPAVMIDAYARLFAWKLSLHGIDASSTSQRVGSSTFKAINGHRDAGSTACPGRYLYAQIPAIRTKAAQYQADWSGRNLVTNVVSTAYPDILLRRASDKVGFALPTQGYLRWKAAVTSSTGWSRYDAVVATPDVTGDGLSDVIVRNGTTRVTSIRPGDGKGGFGAATGSMSTVGSMDQITAVGDVHRNGFNDFVARDPKTGYLHLYRGTSKHTFSRVVASTSWGNYVKTIGAGDTNRDGFADVYSIDKAGVLWFHAGTGTKSFKAPVRMAGAWAGFDLVTGTGDFTGDGIGDLYARSKSSHLAYVFPGRGNGTFGHWLGPFGRIGTMTPAGAADVIGTKSPDVLALSGDTLKVIPHNGTQNTSGLVRTTVKGFAAANALLNVGDWDRDGHGDMVIRNASTAKLELIRGLGGNRFAEPVVIGTGWSRVGLLSAVGDTTGDGFPDLMGQPSGAAMRIYPGAGKGFRRSYVARGAISALRQVGIGRWDADGAPDNLFRVGSKIVKYTGNGPGGLSGSPVTLNTVSLTPYDWVISPGDIDRDGRPDLVVRRKSDATLWVLSGRPGGFGTPKFLAEGMKGFDLAG
ncbi:FG-GAP-like repeat-containing protein [Nocardioides sp. Root151]|uniref:FG-GAP-like repeat-containing protein n=1 Tax=Nocardioides sp. Root151 TaxID=1736475 RepID=UPI000703360F|nr:FG-GAP-like repeat-containing protein [Nocardioides sp. Root151]KQZ75239.1 hypothetical protein ASD66_02380 [Nocardioides sp. Root151]